MATRKKDLDHLQPSMHQREGGGGGLYSKKPSKEGPKKSSRWRAVWCIFCNAHVVNRCILSQILLSQTRRQGHASNITKQLVINALWPNLLRVPIKVGISFVDSRRYGHSRIFSAYFTNESFIGKKSKTVNTCREKHFKPYTSTQGDPLKMR